MCCGCIHTRYSRCKKRVGRPSYAYQDEITTVLSERHHERPLNRARFAPQGVLWFGSPRLPQYGLLEHMLMMEVYHGSPTRRKARPQSEPK